jgi:hypothetical protein
VTPKLTSRQLAQLGFLETLPPKFERWHNIVEQMASLQADEATVRNLCRSLDETKTQAGTLNLTGLGDTMGMMGCCPAERRTADEGAGAARAWGLKTNFEDPCGRLRRRSPPAAGPKRIGRPPGRPVLRTMPSSRAFGRSAPSKQHDHGVDQDADQSGDERQGHQDQVGADVASRTTRLEHLRLNGV